MKINDIRKIVPLLKREEISLPLEELSEEERESIYESIHYCDLADSQLK